MNESANFYQGQVPNLPLISSGGRRPQRASLNQTLITKIQASPHTEHCLVPSDERFVANLSATAFRLTFNITDVQAVC